MAGEAAALRKQAESQLLAGDGEGALAAALKAVEASGGDAAGRASGLDAAARGYRLLGDAAKGLEAAREALLIFHKAGDKGGTAAARQTCAALRGLALAAPEKPVAAPYGLCRLSNQCVPGFTGPATIGAVPWTASARVCGSNESRQLVGVIALVTGASRGIGKGVATALAEYGAIVYVTGRSTSKNVTDPLLEGNVDETVNSFAKMGGEGVAVHMDHAQETQNDALAALIASNHGRLDVCVNNAFHVPKPDLAFFSTELWNQPIRFLNEQAAVGGLNHAAQTLRLLPILRHGRGVVVNISSCGSQVNIPTFPASYLANKAAFDRTTSALAEHLRQHHVYVMTLWPGKVRNERRYLAARHTGEVLADADMETHHFTGQAVVELARMPRETLHRSRSRTGP